MINQIELNKYIREILFHILILLVTSIGAFLKISNYFDYILIMSVLIFCRNPSQFSSYYPLTLFIWGFYSDLLIGYPLGYSGTIFLFFFLLRETSLTLIDNGNIKARFYFYLNSLLLFLFFEYVAIKLFYNVNLSLLNYLIQYLLMLVIFYPISKIFMYTGIYNEK